MDDIEPYEILPAKGNALAWAAVETKIDEVKQLRQIISDCAAALPGGAFISPNASIEFMQKLPAEIRASFTVDPKS